jgi:hypothetical protein
VFSKLPRLPTLLGQFVHTAPLFWALPLEVSALLGLNLNDLATTTPPVTVRKS